MALNFVQSYLSNSIHFAACGATCEGVHDSKFCREFWEHKLSLGLGVRIRLQGRCCIGFLDGLLFQTFQLIALKLNSVLVQFQLLD